MIDKTPKSHC